jgi:hypothetical protein
MTFLILSRQKKDYKTTKFNNFIKLLTNEQIFRKSSTLHGGRKENWN